MLSRRSFLVRAFGSLVFFELNECLPAWAKLGKKQKQQVVVSGPHSLSKQAWPPAIIPDFVDIDKKGYLCFSDQFGRFSVVDLRKAGTPKAAPKVISELAGIGKRVLSLKVAKLQQAFALVKDPAEGPESKYYLVAIDLKLPNLPAVQSQTHLSQFDEADLMLADKDAIFVSGKARSGEFIVNIYTPPGKKGQKDATFISSVATKLPVVALDFQKRELIVVQDNGLNTKVDFYNLSAFISPQLTNSLEIKGVYSRLNRQGDTLILAGQADQSGRQLQASTIALKPAPHAVSTVELDGMEQILSTTSQKGQYLVLTKSTSGKLMLNSLTVDKLNNLDKTQTVEIPVAKSASIERASMVVNGKEMYVATGWSGVQVLTFGGTQWSQAYSYKIPRLAASGIASWGNQVVLVGAELMLYDIANPELPQLIGTAPLTASVKAMVGAGSYILCLEKDAITIRKMAQLDRVLTSQKVSGKSLTFDKSQHKVYVADPMGKLTRVYPFKVFSDNLEAAKSFDLPGNFPNVESIGGIFLGADIHEVALFSIEGQVKELGRHQFENLAIRDACMTDKSVLATAVDQNSKGFLLVLSKKDKELHLEGTVDLPHNGTALSATATRAVAVGQDPSGKDLVSIVDISNSAAPSVKATFSVLEAASAVAVNSKIALVAGRGLEIVTM
ncbi:MAG: hypothetical protein K2X93_01275 [Candidatus Obscuribacterales bacterium]|nr:hypothetical protein [Candidatus Obscuribacterales bacterium]